MAGKDIFRFVFAGIFLLAVCPVYALVPPDDGLRAEMAGEWQRAIAIYENVLKTEPERDDLWSRIADIKIHLKDRAGAIEALERAVKINPDDAAMNSRLATLLVMEKQQERALPYAAKAKEIEPDNIKYLQAHARLANWLKRFPEAAESYEKIYLLQPSSEDALRNLANTWSWAERHDKAVSLYEKYLRKHPEKVDIWLALSREKIRQGDRKGAIAAFSRAAALRPNDAKIKSELSRLYAMTNEPEKALSYASEAVQAEPDNIEYLRAHAQIANWLKRPDEAIKSLEKIVALNPDDDKARLDLANTYTWAGEQEKATALYEKHLARNPDDINLWLLAADSKARQKDVRGAAELLRKAYDRFFSSSAPVKRVKRDESVKLPVLLYHCVGDRADNDYWMSATEFDAQMKWLKEKGYQSITSRDLESYLFGSGKLPEKPVMITFDDACHNLYTHAWPILKKNGFVADIYIFTGAIRDSAANRASITQHVNGKETRLDYLIWPEIREMLESGFAIGAHSKTHADMNTLDREQLRYEILASKLHIFAKAGIVATSFSYPFGSGFNRPEAHQELAAAGFNIVFAAHGGVENLRDADLMKIRRVEIWGPHPKIDPGSKGVSVIPDPLRPYDLFRNRLEPDEAVNHYELSRLYSVDEKPKLAYREIKKALALEPESRRYLRFMTQLVDWNDEDEVKAAIAGYRKLVALGEKDDELLLNQARISSYSGELDTSARLYKKYLQSHPGDRTASMEQVQVESWRGNPARAMDFLQQYQEKYGEDKAWIETKAEILSWVDRPTETVRLVEPALEKEPDNYKLNFANALAQHFGGQPRKALNTLKMMEARYPGAKDNPLLRKIVTTPHRPEVSFDVAYVTSSEDLEALSSKIQGKYSLTPEARLDFKYVHEWFSARQGSGLETVDGSEEADYQNIQAGIRYRFSPVIAGNFYVGQAQAEQDSIVIYGMDLDIEPVDSLDLRIEHHSDYFHEYFSSSPRTISLGIEADTTRFYLNWRPDFYHTVSAGAGYSRFSDDNSSKNLSLAISRAVAKTQHWNVDLGLSAALLDFAEERDNGYYDPDNYQRYMLTSSSYWKAGAKGGISIALAIGSAKDDTMSGFEFASEAGVSGRFDLGDDWLFRFGISGVHNVTRGGGAYTGNGVNASVTRRF